MKKYIVLLCILCGALYPQIPSKYHSDNDLTQALKQITLQYPSVVKMAPIAKTSKGLNLWSVAIGKGNLDEKKALLIVGGIEAPALVGSEHALRFIEQMARSYGTVDSITKLLDHTTIYVIPRANPDAGESFFAKPLKERETDFTPFDDDRDAAVDEDDVDDVNKDGIISWMRIKDPRGEWMIHPDDPRLMKKADPSKGEKGVYRLFSEGIDNDKDEEWNEDPAGGTDFNRNFTYNYQFFGKNSGIHQVSEEATRALANFVFDHPNIGTVFTFSSNDNLMTAWKNEPPKGEGPVITSVAKEDEDYYGYISKKFSDITKLKDAPKPVKGEGAFSEWAYYHAGRWSVAARPWWSGEMPTLKDTSAVKDSTKRTETKKEEKGKSEDPNLKILKWYDAAGRKDIAVPWTAFKHPDFPDREVEIGGVKPFVLLNPPSDSLNAYSRPYTEFLIGLAGQLPSISLTNQKAEKLGDNVYRVSIDVVNNGYLPTNNTLGAKVRWVRNVRVVLDGGRSASISSGKAKQVLDPIKGSGGFRTVSWIVMGKGAVSITADSPVAGSAEIKIELK